MTKKQPSSAPMGRAKAQRLVAWVAQRHQISTSRALTLIVRSLQREREQKLAAGWWLDLLDAQFQTHIGSTPRIRCGDETHLAHLIPDLGAFCHDCGCARGEYHVFGCDAEECSHCGEQAFCCDCDDGTERG